MRPMRLTPETLDLLRCPACRGTLNRAADALTCASCGRRYPIANGIPILIDEEQSVFDIAAFAGGAATFFKPHGRLFRLFRAVVPEVVLKPNTRRNLKRMRELLLERDRARVLVVGGSIRGAAMDELEHPKIELVETDAAHGPRTALICDGHSLPFADGSFDGVLAQCVLEHVVDPDRCVAEFHRVLRPGGVAYAETAFLQHVHGGRYDFNRYSELGHRRLFRRFETVDSGAADGPATVVAWAYEQLLLTLVPARRLRNVVKALARWTSFFMKYLDVALLNTPAARDGASAVYFLGTRSDKTLSDRELLTLYRGND
jgi:SAM-dependent methyltransferase